MAAPGVSGYHVPYFRPRKGRRFLTSLRESTNCPPDECALSVAIVIPVFNQLPYTRKCIESLRASEGRNADLIVIDNWSSDGTAGYLEEIVGITVARNPRNVGVAKAWNQGVHRTRAEWVVFLNNDIVVPAGWLDGLLSFAREGRYEIVTPAMREGDLDYDLASFAPGYIHRMRNVYREGLADGACFMVRRSVFEVVGPFDENFHFGQFEDADFFLRARLEGFRSATTGRSLVHHFGSVTQNAIRKDPLVGDYEEYNRKYFRLKWGLMQPERFLVKRRRKWNEFLWKTNERLMYGHTLKERRVGGRLVYS